METANNRSSFIKGFKRIASVHLVGFLCIVLATALFFAAAKCISDSGVTLMDMRGFQLIEEMSEVENNFKKLSFNLNLSGIAEWPGFIVFKKGIDLKGRSDYQNLYFFISVETGELDKALLSFLKIKVFLDEALVWSMPVSEIGTPTFVEQNIDFLNSKDLSEISFQVGCDPPDSAEQKEIMDQSIYIAIEYLDIR